MDAILSSYLLALVKEDNASPFNANIVLIFKLSWIIGFYYKILGKFNKLQNFKIGFYSFVIVFRFYLF